jgi:hypothetical protein
LPLATEREGRRLAHRRKEFSARTPRTCVRASQSDCQPHHKRESQHNVSGCDAACSRLRHRPHPAERTA